MTIEEQLARDEGKRLQPYTDTRGLWTIGIGHCFETTERAHIPLAFQNGITDGQCSQLFNADLLHVYDLLNVYLPWWSALDIMGRSSPRSGVLVNMAFNMGVAGLCKFHTFLDLMRACKWQAAADDLASTAVYKQLPERYARLRQQIITGAWQ